MNRLEALREWVERQRREWVEQKRRAGAERIAWKRAYNRSYYARHRERFQTYFQAYYDRHRERILAANKVRAATNKERIKAYQAKYRARRCARCFENNA